MRPPIALLFAFLLPFIALADVQVLDFSQYGYTSTSTVYEGHFALFVVQSANPTHGGFYDTKFFVVDSHPSANHSANIWYELSTKQILGSLSYAAAGKFMLVTADAVVLVPVTNPSLLTVIPLTNTRPDLTLSAGIGFDSRDQTVWLTASSTEREGTDTVLYQVSLNKQTLIKNVTVSGDLKIAEPLTMVYIAINEISNFFYLFSSTDNQFGCGITRVSMSTYQPKGFVSLDCNAQDIPLGVFEDSARNKIYALTSQAAGTLAIVSESTFDPSATTFQPIDTTFNGLAAKYGSKKTDYGLISSLDQAYLYSTEQDDIAAKISLPIPSGNYVNAIVADSVTDEIFLVADQSAIIFHRSDMTPASFL